MHYRKSKILMFLTMVGLGLGLSTPARADTGGDDANRAYFKGPTNACLRHATLVYPCVSLSPPAYQSNLGSGILYVAVGPDLPLDTGFQDESWFDNVQSSEYWSKWHLSRPLQEMNMDFSLDDSGAAVNMNLGPLKFNVFAEDGGISESRISLGIERSW